MHTRTNIAKALPTASLRLTPCSRIAIALICATGGPRIARAEVPDTLAHPGADDRIATDSDVDLDWGGVALGNFRVRLLHATADGEIETSTLACGGTRSHWTWTAPSEPGLYAFTVTGSNADGTVEHEIVGEWFSVVEPRPFRLGFTDFPYAATTEAVIDTVNVVNSHADLYSIHLDDGVPWQEAHDGTYDGQYIHDLLLRAAAIGPDQQVSVSISPVSGANEIGPERASLATHIRGPAGPWRDRLDHPAVVKAYAGYALTMAEIFDADYLIYGIEGNIVLHSAPERWPEYLSLMSQVYTYVSSQRPDLPLIISIATEYAAKYPTPQIPGIEQLLVWSDAVGLATYPYTLFPSVAAIPGNYYEYFAQLAPHLPLVFTEAGWPAETVDAPYPLTLPSSPDEQAAFVHRLLYDAARLDSDYVSWFFSRDFDDMWESHFVSAPGAERIRLWRDTGLMTGDGTPRPSMATWGQWLSRPHSNVP